jgi:hypothetical protein
MKITSRILVGSVISVAFLVSVPIVMAAASKEARVTQIIRDVKLLPSEAAARPAAVNDKVSEDTGVRTGGDSRSELTFSDLTITRLGANTIFSFSKAGRTAKVDSGSILLRVPKDSGGGTIRNNTVTVAVTGTTVIFEANRPNRRLMTLEGSARVSLTAKPREFRNVLAGQMIDVPAGATTLPMPVNIDLNDVMRNHPLITDFKPLPSQPLIMAAAQQPQSAPPPTYSGPQIAIDIFGGFTGGTRHHGPRRDPKRPPSNQPPTTSQTSPTPPPPVLNRTPGSIKTPPTTTTTIPRPQRIPKPKPTPSPSGPR